MNETPSLAPDWAKSPVNKALRLLSHLARCEGSLSLAELASALELPKPTSYRLARSLKNAGFVQQDPLTRRYSIGAELEHLALSALKNGPGHSARRLLMDELAETIGARINLAVLKAGKVLFVEWVESTAPLRVDLNPETRIPVHCSASGKLLMAFSAGPLAIGILRSAPFKALTKSTLTTAAALRREFELIRARGYSEDAEEFLPGVCCIAVPVRDRHGSVVAGLAAMAPLAMQPLEKMRRHVPQLMRCAACISAELGWKVAPAAGSQAVARKSGGGGRAKANAKHGVAARPRLASRAGRAQSSAPRVPAGAPRRGRSK